MSLYSPITADVLGLNSSFGREMGGRIFNNDESEFGYNGKQNIKEWSARLGSVQNYGARIKIGESWTSVDPYFRSYPSNSPYSYALNNPIMFQDFEGSKIIFSLALRLFHRDVYKAQLTFLKSDAGKALYRDLATKRQARKLWGDKGGSGSLSRNYDVVFKYDESVGGNTSGELKVDGKWVDTQDFTEETAKKVNGNTDGRIIVKVHSEQETFGPTPTETGIVEGDHLRLTSVGISLRSPRSL